MVRILRACLILVGAVAATESVARAQLVRAKAEVTPLVERDSVRAGASIRVVLQVSLPEGLHVQSDKPRDPNLIPTEVKVEPPDGVVFTEVVYPLSTDLKQVGQDQPLAVFERAFTIGGGLTSSSPCT